MKWKPAILIALFLAVVFAVPTAAQSTTQCPQGQVCITQETANRLFKAVDELIAAQDTIKKLLAERGAADASLAAALKVIEGYKELDAVNAAIIVKHKDMVALYEKTIQLYAGLVEKLEKKLMAPKTGWAKFLDFLKTAATIAAGILIGRGL